MIRQMLEVNEERRATLHDLEAFFNLEGEKMPMSREASLWEQQPSDKLDPPRVDTPFSKM
jgi:hypothetical protein